MSDWITTAVYVKKVFRWFHDFISKTFRHCSRTKQTDRQPDRQTNRQTGGSMDGHRNIADLSTLCSEDLTRLESAVMAEFLAL